MKKIIAIALAIPSMALAQTANLPAMNNINDVSARFLSIGNMVLYFLVALAVIFIVYNVVWYVIKPSDATDKPAHGWNILWGIVGLFIIVSIWGLVNLFTGTFSLSTTKNPAPNLTNYVDQGGMPINQLPIVK